MQQADTPPSVIEQANTLRANGQIHTAIVLLSDHLQQQPEDCDARVLLAAFCMFAQRYFEAIKQYNSVMAVADCSEQVHFALGVCYENIAERQQAITQYEQAIQLNPAYINAYLNLANLYNIGGRSRKAQALLTEALLHHPVDIKLLYSLGQTYYFIGDFIQAEHYFNAVLAQQPNHPYALSHMVKLIKQEDRIRLYIDNIEQAIKRIETTDQSTAILSYALGDLYEKLQDYDAAFASYSQANMIKNNLMPADDFYTPKLMRRVTTIIDQKRVKKFNPEVIAEKPIFIVGMPRAGTTLLYSRIEGHPDVVGIGEHNAMHALLQLADRLIDIDKPYPEFIDRLKPDELKGLRQYYLDAVDYRDGYYTLDKNNMNFVHVGLIFLLFPEARVIHCQRNAIDTCVSCFFQDFSLSTMAFTNDLNDLLHMYQAYQQLMQHWQTIFSDRILTIQYEAMVSDPAVTLQIVFQYLRLTWHEKYAKQVTESINTASSWQVRQPIYNSSIEKWRRYQKHIAVLIAQLSS